MKPVAFIYHDRDNQNYSVLLKYRGRQMVLAQHGYTPYRNADRIALGACQVVLRELELVMAETIEVDKAITESGGMA